MQSQTVKDSGEWKLKMGDSRHWLFPFQSFPSSYNPCVLETGSIQERQGCFSNVMDSQKRICFPPFSPTRRVLQKVLIDQAMLILLTSEWKTRSWYPQLLKLSIQSPLILPKIPNLLQGPNKKHHLLITKENLRFLACIFSGQDYFQNEYQRSLQLSSQMPDNQVESLNTNFPGINGIANVLGEKLIPLNFLWLKIFNSIRLKDLGPHIMTPLDAFISATVLYLSISVLSLLF